MQPTKLPDEFFPDDEWQRADYAGRVNLLLSRFHGAREESREAWESVSLAAQERDLLLAELRGVREVNAGLVLEIEDASRALGISGKALKAALEEIEDSHRLLSDVAAVTEKK